MFSNANMGEILDMYAKMGIRPEDLKFSKKVVCASENRSGASGCPFSSGGPATASKCPVSKQTTESQASKGGCPFSSSSSDVPPDEILSSRSEGQRGMGGCPVMKASTQDELPDWAKKYLREKELESQGFTGGCPVMRGASSGGSCPVFSAN